MEELKLIQGNAGSEGTVHLIVDTTKWYYLLSIVLLYFINGMYSFGVCLTRGENDNIKLTYSFGIGLHAKNNCI